MTQTDRLRRYAQKEGMVRARDLGAMGIARAVLKRSIDRGDLVRRSRGIYVASNHEPTRHTDLAQVCAQTPQAIVCLISALEFHGLTTQIPHNVWIMIDRTRHKPRIALPRIRVVHASGRSLSAGVDNHVIEGVRVRITSPAKTVVDCFRYRRHVGLDVAIEAIRDCLQQRKATPGEIHHFAVIGRVARTIRPFLQALT